MTRARQCSHANPVGFITNQDPAEPHDFKRFHASLTVCNRALCHVNAIEWVERFTREPAKFYPFERR